MLWMSEPNLVAQQVCQLVQPAPALDGVADVVSPRAHKFRLGRHCARRQLLEGAEVINLALHIGQPVPVAPGLLVLCDTYICVMLRRGAFSAPR